MCKRPRARAFVGGEGGIRTHVGRLCPHPISSRRRYDRFGTSPAAAYSIQTMKPCSHCSPPCCWPPAASRRGCSSRCWPGGELRVVTRNSPDAYYLGSHGPEGPAYELASRLCRAPRRRAAPLHGTHPRGRHPRGRGGPRPRRRGRHSPPASSCPTSVHYGPGYHLVREHLVYRRRDRRPASITEAGRGQIEVAAGSAHQRTLEDLRLQHPELAWVERADTETEEILADVSRGTVQYTLASSTEFALNRLVHPELAIALDLSPERAIAWVVSTAAHDRSLLDRVNAFFAGARAEGTIAQLLDRYYGERDRVRLPLLAQLPAARRDAPAALPRVVPGGGREVPARLAAARGDGLPGIEVGPARRLVHRRARPDAAHRGHGRDDARRRPPRSAHQHLRRRELPVAPAEDRAASASPNPTGPGSRWRPTTSAIGHVEDARVLAQQHGRNPDRWEDVREFLPLLSQERWYTRTRRGYARGWEPVRYVDNVQAYLNILAVAGIGAPPPRRSRRTAAQAGARSKPRGYAAR